MTFVVTPFMGKECVYVIVPIAAGDKYALDGLKTLSAKIEQVNVVKVSARVRMSAGMVVSGMNTGSHNTWLEQSEAAESIKAKYGVGNALGYLIGENLADFVRQADRSPQFAQELPRVLQEISQRFQVSELHTYFEGARSIGPLAHVCSPAVLDEMRRQGVIESRAVREAEECLLIERIKHMLHV